MALYLKQELKMTHQLMMTQEMQQAIKMLQLSSQEMQSFLDEQMQDNPLLETVTELGQEPEVRSEDLFSSELKKDSLTEEVSWQENLRFEDFNSYSKASKNNQSLDDELGFESYVSKNETLFEHLYRQAKEINFSDEELKIAILIMGNLDEKGYLDTTLEEMCEKEELDFELAEGVLDTIQRFDPIAVGSRSLKECLLIQLRENRLYNGVVEKLITHHLELIQEKNFQKIIQLTKLTKEELFKNTQIIQKLDPRPARAFGYDPVSTIKPDAYIFKIKDKWQITLSHGSLPEMTINQNYKNLKNDGPTSKAFLNEKMKNAQWLFKSIEQRNRTIYKVCESILKKQIDFFEKGISHLKPMILKDISNEIGMHESTVSRVSNNKYVHTPRGIFEIKYFFNSSLSGTGHEDRSSESIRQCIKEIVEKESKLKPFSDQKIVDMLKNTQSVVVARRTVAKYREELGIEAASKRKNFFKD